MTKTQALAQARNEINMGYDNKSVHIYDPHVNGTRVVGCNDYWQARGFMTSLRFERVLALLGFAVDDAHYMSENYDYGRLETRVNSALKCRTIYGWEPTATIFQIWSPRGV